MTNNDEVAHYLCLDSSARYLPVEKLDDGCLYLIHARNSHIGWWEARQRGFVILREKHGERFLFTEFHCDTSPHGTAKPFLKISEPVPKRGLIALLERKLRAIPYSAFMARTRSFLGGATINPPMLAPIHVIPSLKRVRLCHVGCWHSLDIRLVPHLNLIVTEAGGVGASTVLKSILHAVHRSEPRHLLRPSEGYEHGEITVEFRSTSLRVGVSASAAASPERHQSPEPRQCIPLSQSSLSLNYLRLKLQVSQPKTAILIDDDVTGALDEPDFATAVELLRDAPCQVIAIIGNRLTREHFPGAHVLTCSWDRRRRRAVLQPRSEPHRRRNRAAKGE